MERSQNQGRERRNASNRRPSLNHLKNHYRPNSWWLSSQPSDRRNVWSESFRARGMCAEGPGRVVARHYSSPAPGQPGILEIFLNLRPSRAVPLPAWSEGFLEWFCVCRRLHWIEKWLEAFDYGLWCFIFVFAFILCFIYLVIHFYIWSK